MTKGGGKADSEDWACCEKCSYGFTILVGVIFFLGGAAMAVYAGLWMFGNIAIEISGLEVLEAQTALIQWAIFIVGICIAATALLGMIMAGCAKCAANPDGVNDGCEKCCTAALSIVYIIILSLLLAATLAIAGGLSYYASTVADGASANCPYSDATSRFVSPDNGGTPPDALTCPLDVAIYEAFFASDTVADTFADGWVVAQDLSVTCGYYCDVDDFCSPILGSDYDVQTTGTFCTQSVPSDVEEPENTVYQGTTPGGVQQAFRTGAPVTMPYRPTLYALLNDLLIPFLVVWWIIFVLAVLLIVAACVMCIRKSKTEKKATYKP